MRKSPLRPRRAWLGPALMALPVLLALLFFWAFVVPGVEARAGTGFGAFPTWDLETYFLPKFAFGSQELLHGVLPVWNRYEFAGIPFLAAAQPAALYPFKVPFYALLGPEAALRAVLVVHLGLLALLFLLFARSVGMGAAGTATATLFVACTAPMLLLVTHPIGYTCLAWVPAILLLADRFARAPRPASFAGLGAVVAIQLTGGYPEVCLNLGLLVALHAVVLWTVGETRETPLKVVPLLAAAFALAALAAGVQTFPLLELVKVTGRAGFAAEQSAEGSLAVSVASPGVPALVGLALAALWRGRRRAAPPLVGALACFFMAVYGWRLLRLVPGLEAIRLTGSWPYLFQFYLAWLVGLGVDGLLEPARVRRLPRALAAGVALCWAAICLMQTLWPGFTAGSPDWLAAVAPPAAPPALRLLSGSLVAAGSLLLSLAVLGPAGLRFRGAWLAAGALVLVLGQLASFPFGRPLMRIAQPETPLRTQALLGHAGVTARVLSLADARGGFHLTDRIENVFGREGSLRPPRFRALQDAFHVVVQKQQIHWKVLGRHGAVLDTLDVGYVLAPTPQADTLAPAGLVPTRFADGRMRLYENRDRPGRAWAVYGAHVVASPEDALARILEPDFDPRREVVLEHAPRDAYPERATRPSTPARVRYPAPTRVDVEVEMAAPGFLVLADSCFEGWKAWVDGAPAEILCANFVVRAVELGSGRHEVRFEYRSPALRSGLWASAAGIATLCAIPWLASRRRRSVERHPGRPRTHV